MGKLKPIGSEKLEGMEKINRILEIARYKENIPKPINEDTSLEYKKVLSDGNTYQIVKEKNGYVIKRGLNESISDYLEPMKNRKYYSSYSQALKRLNLIAKEVNVNEGYDKNLSLFNEGENDEKYYLKFQTNEQEATPAPAPSPEPESAPLPEPESTPLPDLGDTPEMDSEMEDSNQEDIEDEEEVSFKTIQKLTGRLGQKIRTFLSKEENQMTSKDIKYVINSILSALKLDSLEEEDREEIISKFEGGEEEMGMEDSEEEMGMEEPVEPEAEMNIEVPEPPQPEGEMGETMDKKKLVASFFNEEEEIDERNKHRGPGASRSMRLKHRNLKDEDAMKMEEMIEGIFNESKVEKVLKKYFKIDEKEKLMLEEQRKKSNKETENTNKTKQRIKNLSENIAQEVTSTKLVNKYPEAKLIGKNKNNKCLVFEVQNKTIKITPKGGIL